ncbi:MAG: hypothetical protein ABH858_07515 [Candidatus Omnitrophota bacterium]
MIFIKKTAGSKVANLGRGSFLPIAPSSKRAPGKETKTVCLGWLIVLALSGSSAFGQSLLLSDLLANAGRYDNQSVVVEGEVIGEALDDDQKGLWINISQAGVNLGVYLQDSSSVDKIKHFGSFQTRGDSVEIRGVFYNLCPYHFERDIHVERLSVVKPGFRRKIVVSPRKRLAAFVLSIIYLTIAVVYLIRIRYGSRN